MNIALDDSLSEDDQAVYLTKAEQIVESRERYAKEWKPILRGEGVYRMGNVANRQCPMCRSTDIQQKWVNTNYYFQCNSCGERWNS